MVTTSSSLVDFFGTLGSVDQDLLLKCLIEMIDASSEASIRPVKYTLHQLRREADRERRKVDVARGQLHEVERVLGKLNSPKNGNHGPETAFLLAALQGRAEDLQTRLSESPLDEKVSRMERLKQTLKSVRNRAEAARKLLEIIDPDRLKEMPDARSRIP